MDWKGRIAYLATLHRKEEVIAPLLAEHLGIQVQVIPLDTDQFGTFSRERPRPGDPLHTLRLKIERARQAYPAPLVLASEGSFGPHPQIPWIPWNQEWVMLKVFESGADPLELVGYAESTQTNFSHRWVQSFAEALDFAQKVGFPEHALIALDQPENPQVIHKGIQDEATLRQVVEELLARQQGCTWKPTCGPCTTQPACRSSRQPPKTSLPKPKAFAQPAALPATGASAPWQACPAASVVLPPL